MDLGQFTWTNLFAAITLVITGASMLFGVWWHLEQRIRAAKASADEKVRDVERQLADFKLHVVEKYASWDTVEKTTKRLEDRIESMASDVSKMPDVVVERMMKFLDLKRL